MKKTVCLTLILIVLVGLLVGCGSNSKYGDNTIEVRADIEHETPAYRDEEGIDSVMFLAKNKTDKMIEGAIYITIKVTYEYKGETKTDETETRLMNIKQGTERPFMGGPFPGRVKDYEVIKIEYKDK